MVRRMNAQKYESHALADIFPLLTRKAPGTQTSCAKMETKMNATKLRDTSRRIGKDEALNICAGRRAIRPRATKRRRTMSKLNEKTDPWAGAKGYDREKLVDKVINYFNARWDKHSALTAAPKAVLHADPKLMALDRAYAEEAVDRYGPRVMAELRARDRAAHEAVLPVQLFLPFDETAPASAGP
jgi:hypothetical protein